MTCYYCIANDPDGLEITPRPLSRVRQGKYWVPDCVDYQTKFNLPRRLKLKEIFSGWSCYNCKCLQERSEPEERPEPEKNSEPEDSPAEKKS